MSAVPPHPASHRVLVISGIVAAIAVTLCALVAVAFMLGWLPARSAVPQATSIAPGASLLPGESVVMPESTPGDTRPAPTTPSYARTPPPADPVPREPEPPPPVKPARPASPAPKPPAYARVAPQPAICENCGSVVSTTTYPDRWEVRVRYEDGTNQIVRYRSPPDFRIGQRVRLEDGRLVRDP